MTMTVAQQIDQAVEDLRSILCQSAEACQEVIHLVICQHVRQSGEQ